MITLKTEESQEPSRTKRFFLRKQVSESKLGSAINHNEIHKPSKYSNEARKLILPQVQPNHEPNIPQIKGSPSMADKNDRVEYFKLPEIDEKFFIRKTYNEEFIRPKIHFHSHQVSREEIEFMNSEKQIQQSIQSSQKRVEFQEDVLVIDYINQTCRKGNIDGSSKPLKLKRQQTKKFSDDICKESKEKAEQNIFRYNAKSHFFDEQTKEIQTQRKKISDILNEPFQF